MWITLCLLLLPWLYSAQHCVRTQHDWAARPTAATMGFCNASCLALLQSDAARQLQPQNALWVAAAHQHCAAALNAASVDVKGLGAALLLVGDSLTRACLNLSHWTLTPSLAAPMALLYAFNQGALSDAPPCLTQANEASEVLYFYQAPDLLTWRLRDNTTVQYSVMKGYYNTQLFLCLLSVVALLGCVALGLWVIMLRNTNRMYRLRRDGPGTIAHYVKEGAGNIQSVDDVELQELTLDDALSREDI